MSLNMGTMCNYVVLSLVPPPPPHNKHNSQCQGTVSLFTYLNATARFEYTFCKYCIVLLQCVITLCTYNQQGRIYGGGGGEGAAAPPFVWVWDILRQCPRMIHGPLRTYGFQTTKCSQKHCICKTSTCISRELRDPDFKIFPGEYAPGPP